MSGLVKQQVQLGDSATATNNFVLTSAAADGTMKLARGNYGATTQDVMTVNASGQVTLTQGMASMSGGFYETYDASSTACTGAITTATIWGITKLGRVVTLELPTVTGTGVAVPSFTFGLTIPSVYRPANSVYGFCYIRDNNTSQVQPGLIYVGTNGVITVFKNPDQTTNFTVTASAGLLGKSTISWVV